MNFLPIERTTSHLSSSFVHLPFCFHSLYIERNQNINIPKSGRFGYGKINYNWSF